MTSELKVDKITPASGTNTQIGEAGDTTNLSAGTVTLLTSIITGATEKTPLVDADKFLISDSAASGAFKHVQKSNLPSGAFTILAEANTTTDTNALQIDNVFDSSKYHFYRFMAFFEPTSDAAELRFRFRTSSPADASGATYRGQTSRQYRDGSSSGAGQNYGFWSQSYATISWAYATSLYGNAFVNMDMHPIVDGNFASRVNFVVSNQDDGSSPQEQNYYGAFMYGETTNLNNGGITFYNSSGDFSTMKYLLLGYNKA